MMHISSSEVNPKTRFAGTHFPVPKPAQSASDAQRRAAPVVVDPLFRSKFPWRISWAMLSPGGTPGVTSQPIFMGRVGSVPVLSCVQVYRRYSFGWSGIPPPLLIRDTCGGSVDCGVGGKSGLHDL